MHAAVAAPARLRAFHVGLAVAVTVAAAVLALVVGPTEIPRFGVLAEVADRILPGSFDSGLTDSQATIVWKLRLPRVVLGLMVGSILGLTGATYQGAFRNPLADPYLLGAAGGAGFGATIAIVQGWGDGRGYFDLVPIAAFAAALLAVSATYVVGVLGDRSRSTASLILAGVAVTSFFTAMQTYTQQRNAETIRQVYSWILGSLTTSGWLEVSVLLPYFVVAAVVLVANSRNLDVLGVGDEEALTLGLDAARMRTVLIVVASLAVAAAVAVSGLIAFVGLIVPHTVRLLFGTSHRIVVPLSIFVGGAFLVLCDLLARTVLSPAELPIGVVTAFFGAPFFIIVLRTAHLR